MGSLKRWLYPSPPQSPQRWTPTSDSMAWKPGYGNSMSWAKEHSTQGSLHDSKCVPKKRGQLNCCSQNSSVWQSLRIDAAQNSMFKAAECALFAAQPHQIQDLVDVTCRNRTNIISLIKPHESTDQCFRGANVTRRRSGARPSVPARLPAAGKYFSTCYTTCLCYMLTCKKNKFQHVRQKSTVIEKFVQDALYATKR